MTNFRFIIVQVMRLYLVIKRGKDEKFALQAACTLALAD